MGLDMFLTARIYLWDNEKKDVLNKMFGIESSGFEYTVQDVGVRVAYWRKANAIHHWFVKNCQDGSDDCKEYWVEREKIEELMSICYEVAENINRGKELLPTQGGFFFGPVEFDDDYLWYVKETARMLKRALDDKALKDADFYYSSSW